MLRRIINSQKYSVNLLISVYNTIENVIYNEYNINIYNTLNYLSNNKTAIIAASIPLEKVLIFSISPIYAKIYCIYNIARYYVYNKMDGIFKKASEVYYLFCNPYTQSYVDERMGVDIKTRNHRDLMKLIEDHPLKTLRTMKEGDIDNLARRFSELLKITYFSYPLTLEFYQEVDLVRRRIASVDYRLGNRFRSSFQFYIRDLDFKRSKGDMQGLARKYLNTVHN
jgi:hypothetical protein